MNGYYDYIIKYNIDVMCASPMRTGGSDHNLQEVLLRWDGHPILQGTSLAGAFRGWRDDNILFGNQDREGQIIVSDLVFDTDNLNMRPRLKIDGLTGTVSAKGANGRKAGQKFDIASLPIGTKGHFALVWRNTTEKDENVMTPVEASKRIELYLAALNNGDILLGAQKTNGYGRVILTVKKAVYDLTNSAALNDWLNDVEPTEVLALAKSGNSSFVRFYIKAKTTHLLVKASTGNGIGASGSDAVNIRDNGKLLIPGSSIKGAVRARATDICRICKGADYEKIIAGIFGSTDTEEADGLAGKVRFSEAVVEKEAAKVSRIRIDRFTFGTADKALFSDTPVYGNVSWSIDVPVQDNVACGLVLFALRDLGIGLYTLGSENNIGRGRFEKLSVEAEVDGKKMSICCEHGEAKLQDESGVTEAWLKAVKQ